MKFIPRLIGPQLLRASKHFGTLILTGPRRSGKTTLLRKLFPRASYYLLEDPDMISRLRADARSFIDEVRLPVILDEIQNVPEILNYVRTQIDRFPRKKGQWILTGSQESPLMKGVTESMAGRAAVFQLLPLSTREASGVSLLHGGFPEVLASRSTSPVWFRSYLQTYLERDVRAVSSIRDLATFRRFLALLVSRCGQVLNRTDLAAPLGVSVPTLSEWLKILEVTGQIVLVAPFYENFGKRLIKSPKLYFVDSGLACHLLGIDTEKMLQKSPFLGSLFEGFVASEIIKHQINSGRSKEIYYFRDQQGLEVDFLIPAGNRKLMLIEAKASRTVVPQMADPLKRLSSSISKYEVSSYLVFNPGKQEMATTALRPGIKAASINEVLSILSVKEN
ncbi:MAG: ATP-binding protein [Syntrophaceae bacterium]|nr:ATP-binding protein [Syntrophaceae bacterium]